MELSLGALAVAIGTIILCACSTLTTDNPIGVSRGEWTDTRLVGLWEADVPSARDKLYLVVRPAGDGHLMALVLDMDSMDCNKISYGVYDLVTGRTGGFTFINARPELSDEPSGENGFPARYGSFPLLYRFETDGSIQVLGWSSENLTSSAVAEAIEGGSLAGNIKDGQVRVTADPESLDAFFANSAY